MLNLNNNTLTAFHYTSKKNLKRILREGFVPKSVIVPFNDRRIPYYPRNNRGVFFSLDENFNGQLQGLLEHVVAKTFDPNIVFFTVNFPESYFRNSYILDFKSVMDANDEIYFLNEDFKRNFSLNIDALKRYFGLRRKRRSLKAEAYIQYWNSRINLEQYIQIVRTNNANNAFVIPELVVLERLPKSVIVNYNVFDFREYYPESPLTRML